MLKFCFSVTSHTTRTDSLCQTLMTTWCTGLWLNYSVYMQASGSYTKKIYHFTPGCFGSSTLIHDYLLFRLLLYLDSLSTYSVTEKILWIVCESLIKRTGHKWVTTYHTAYKYLFKLAVSVTLENNSVIQSTRCCVCWWICKHWIHISNRIPSFLMLTLIVPVSTLLSMYYMYYIVHTCMQTSINMFSLSA